MSLQQEDIARTPATEVPSAMPLSAPKRRWFVTLTQAVVVLALLSAFAAAYYVKAFPGHLDRHAADTAQIARNIATGNGFTTNFIRPFNVGFMEVGQTAFPELNSAPFYPYALSALFRVRSVADQTAAQASLALFLVLLATTVLLGRLLFDTRAGLMGAAILGLSAPVLKIAVSGQEWTMASLFFTLLLCAVALHHRAAMSGKTSQCVAYSIASALLVALLYATHYALIVLAVPLLVYFARTGTRKLACSLVFVVVAGILISPLVYRNYTLTGSPVLGVSAWDMMAGTLDYPGDTLYRSIRPDESRIATLLLYPINQFRSFANKLLNGSTSLVASMTAMLGLLGLPFAAVSALYRFRSRQANAVRGFAYGCGAAFLAAFAALGVPEDCVILLCPIVAVVSAAYLLLLMEAKKLHPVFVRFVVIGALLVTSGPAVVSIVWPTNDHDQDMNLRLSLMLTQMHTDAPLYCDQPWVAAWRTLNRSVWLPITDSDVAGLNAMGIPMNVAIMTPECQSYAEDDFWRTVYMVPLWLSFATSEDTAVRGLISMAGVDAKLATQVKRAVTRERRRFTISAASLGAIKRVQTDPLLPDDILIIHRVDAGTQ